MKYLPLNERLHGFAHGGDYNPDQWQKYPDVLAEDIRLMKLAKCNLMSVGIFSWVSLEPEEGVFTFEWLDRILDTFAENGIYALLATPSGARPAWMSARYPEVLRVNSRRVRNLHGQRHNHCFTSPVYREKVRIMNTKLAERYGAHPAVVGWHISNEYGGDCHCDYCQEAFRQWLKNRYKTLDALNDAWWTTFWSHTYTDWSQVESPAPHGESAVHGQNLDWKRFVTDQTVDFCRHEIAPLRASSPNLPVTTNFMGVYDGLNYWKFADILDVISWDNYPAWHEYSDNSGQAEWISMIHDLNRSIKGGKPFLLMESTPSMTNWQGVSKLKRPGMHLLSSLQAVAHGSDSVQYFQWRKSRGSSEKFHGAVVDHSGHENTRVFREVSEVGRVLESIAEISGSTVDAEVAIIFDWENRWAINDAQGPRNMGKKYEETVLKHYRPFWENGISVDIIDMDCDFSKYKLLIAPMLYMVRQGVSERIEEFVEHGGTFVGTYWSGIVNENDLCFLGGFPGPLRKVLGIWSEEIDSLYDRDSNGVRISVDNDLGISGVYTCKDLCDLIHLEGASELAAYTGDFYTGRSALTVNRYGAGEAYYIASRNEDRFYKDLFYGLSNLKGLRRAINSSLPKGVTAQLRSDRVYDYIFIMNFSESEQCIELDNREYWDILRNETVSSSLVLPLYGLSVLKRKSEANA